MQGLIEAVTRTQAVVAFSPEGVITEANRIFLDTMGYELHEVVGKHHRIFMESKAAERPEYAQFWAALCEGKAQQGEFKRLNKAGKAVWLSASYTPVLVEGRVVSIVKLGRDVTQEKMRMVEADSQVAAIRNTQAVVVFDTNGNLLDANDIFLKTMGYELREVVGKHHRIFMESEAADRPEYAQFWAALREGKAQQGEFKRLNKAGKAVWLSAVYTPIVLDGAVIKVIKFAQDTTTEKMRLMDFECQIEAIRSTQVRCP